MNTRLKQFLAAENISQSQFAETINVVRASVSHVLSGRNKPGYDFIKAIMTAYPHLNMEWLMIGRGKMYKSNDSADSVQIRDSHTHMNTEESLFLFEEEPTESPLEDSPIDISPIEQSPLPPTESIINHAPVQTKQRKAIKVMVFFDDGTFQEL